MRIIADATPIAPKWIDLPGGGRLLLRHPTWEDRDRAVTRAANKAEGKQEVTDVTREMIGLLIVEQDGFGKKDGESLDLLDDGDVDRLLKTLSIADVRALEEHVYPVVSEAEAELGN